MKFSKFLQFEAVSNKDGMMPLKYNPDGPHGGKHAIEAYGHKGMKNVMWRKTFKNTEALNKWCDDNDASVEGQREIKESTSDKEAFDKANEKMHAVEDQWHHKILTPHGFKSSTPPQKGFVRSYDYKHPDGREITVHTGARADYWRDQKTGDGGYWASLEPHLAAGGKNK